MAFVEQHPAEPCAHRHRLDVYGDGPFARTNAGRQLGAIPPLLAELAQELFAGRVDSISISEYVPGQGVKPHTDRPEAGPAIRTLSLLGDAELAFHSEQRTVTVQVPRRSLFAICGPCRSPPWKHALVPVTDRRISIAFRCAASA